MDDMTIVRMLDGVENGKTQLNALDGRQAMVVGVAIDRSAGHVLHDEVGQAVGCGAAIEERRDVGMLERSQNLAFVPKSADDQLGVHSAPNHLDGDAPL